MLSVLKINRIYIYIYILSAAQWLRHWTPNWMILLGQGSNPSMSNWPQTQTHMYMMLYEWIYNVWIKCFICEGWRYNTWNTLYIDAVKTLCTLNHSRQLQECATKGPLWLQGAAEFTFAHVMSLDAYISLYLAVLKMTAIHGIVGGKM